MALLLDTSVLVKVFTAEEGSPAAIALLHRPGVLHVGPLTEHELSCALNRKRLAGVLRPAEAAEIEADFRALLATADRRLAVIAERRMIRVSLI